MLKKRKRIKHTATFDERLAKSAAELEEQARRMPIGQERDVVMKKARQTKVAAHINEWLTSPGLRSPR